MNKFIIGGLIALSFLFASCNKEGNEPTLNQKTQTKDLTYIELNVGEDLGDEARTLLYDAGTSANGSPKLKITWGNDGDKVRVFTVIAKYASSGSLKVIHKAPLDWEVTRGGTRLVYKGKIAIPTEELEGVNRLFLTALAGKETGDNEFRKGNGFTALNAGGQANPIDLDVPMLMETELMRMTANRFTNSSSVTDMHKFIPYGSFLTVTIKNNLATPITPNRAKYDFRTDPGPGILVSMNTWFVDEAGDQFELWESEPGERVDNGPYRERVGTRVIVKDRPFNYEYFPAQSIAPGATQHYVIWYPSYDEVGPRFSRKLSFEFREAEATQAIQMLSVPSTDLPSSTSLPSGYKVSYVLEVG